MLPLTKSGTTGVANLSKKKMCLLSDRSFMESNKNLRVHPDINDQMGRKKRTALPSGRITITRHREGWN